MKWILVTIVASEIVVDVNRELFALLPILPVNDACVRSMGPVCTFMRLKTILRDSTRVYLKAETYLSSRRSLRCEKNIHLLLQRLAPQNIQQIYHCS